MLWLPFMALGFGGIALALSKLAHAKGMTYGGADDGDGGDRDRDPDVDTHPAKGTLVERAEHVRELAFQVGAPPAWADMFALIARGESGGNPNKMLGIKLGAPTWAQGGGSSSVEKKEAKAARAVFDTGTKHVKACAWPTDDYCFGSGGLYAMLPMSGIKAFWGTTLECLHPWSVFDEKIGTIMAAHFARRLQLRGGYKGTVWSLRRGWGLPGGMASAPADKLAKWRGHCQDIGLPPSFLDTKLPPWKPIPARDMFHAIGASVDWLPESMQEAA